MRELWRRIAQTGGAKAYTLLTGVLIVAVTARYLGPSGRGELAVVTTWATAFATLFHLSIGQVVLHGAASGQERWLPRQLSALVAWCAAAAILAWASAALIYLISAGTAFGDLSPLILALSLAIVPLMVWEQYGSSLLMALNRLDIANLYQVIGRSVTLATVLLSMWLIGPWVACVLVANMLGQAVVAAGGLRVLRGHVHWHEAPAALPRLLQGGAKLHFNAIGTFLFASCDVLVLNHFAGTTETGYYQLGLQLIAVLMVLPQAVSTVLYAKVAELGPDRAWATNCHLLVQTMGLMMLVIAAAALLAEPAVLLVAGLGFLPAVEVFRWQLLSVLGMSLAAVMAPQWIGRGLFGAASLLTLCFGVLNLLLTFWLAPAHGKLGAAWAGAATFTVSIVTNGGFAWWCSRRSRQALASGSER